MEMFIAYSHENQVGLLLKMTKEQTGGRSSENPGQGCAAKKYAAQ
jgi:hypothetical protein